MCDMWCGVCGSCASYPFESGLDECGKEKGKKKKKENTIGRIGMGCKSKAINLFIYLNDWENVNHSCLANKYSIYVCHIQTYDHWCFQMISMRREYYLELMRLLCSKMVHVNWTKSLSFFTVDLYYWQVYAWAKGDATRLHLGKIILGAYCSGNFSVFRCLLAFHPNRL